MRFLLAVVFALAVYVPASTWDAPSDPGLVGNLDPVMESMKPVNVPEWTPATAAQFPHCNAAPVLADDVVVVRLSGQTQRMPFAEAWTRTHNANKADNVWVIGFCK